MSQSEGAASQANVQSRELYIPQCEGSGIAGAKVPSFAVCLRGRATASQVHVPSLALGLRVLITLTVNSPRWPRQSSGTQDYCKCQQLLLTRLGFTFKLQPDSNPLRPTTVRIHFAQILRHRHVESIPCTGLAYRSTNSTSFAQDHHTYRQLLLALK